MSSPTETLEQEPEHGALLKAFRIMAGMSQRELSDATGISLRMIQEYEQGRCKPSYNRLIAIMVATGLPAESLLPASA